MGRIRELARDVVEKIAAGEVVERPASVVKELVENSIDAGAWSIRINVADGGKGRITVIDDGCGMEPSDLAMSVRRHATSKIANEEDLWNISTMGFRGEALAAIGAVSKLAIETKPNSPGVIEGARVEVFGGEVKGPCVAGCPVGTQVTISDLFYNVPARQKFLRSDAVEYGHIMDIVSSLALANPEIRFDLIGGERAGFTAQAVNGEYDSGGAEERVLSILGRRYREKLCPVCESGGSISVHGWMADDGRRGGKDIHIFVNRRPVRDRMLMHAVTSAMGDGTSRERCPTAVLWIDVDPAEIDVNVHPTKREVRFSNSGAVHDFVRAAVRKTATSDNTFGIPDSGFRIPDSGFQSTNPKSAIVNPKSEIAYRKSPEAQFVMPSAHENKLRPIGQLGLTYVVCEDDDGTLVLIDQHAAHERLGFDSLKSQHKDGAVAGQRLLIPERIELGTKEFGYISEKLDILTAAGFEVELFGGNSIVVKTVPELLSGMSLATIFEDLATELEKLGTSSSVEDVIDRIFAVVACHAQVRAGHRLSASEMTSLVRDVECKGITHCPHGRPAVVRIEQGKIEKWFKRD